MIYAGQVDWTKIGCKPKPKKSKPSEKVMWYNFHFNFVDPKDKDCRRYLILSVPEYALGQSDLKDCKTITDLHAKLNETGSKKYKDAIDKFEKKHMSSSLHLKDTGIKYCICLEIDPKFNRYNGYSTKSKALYKEDRDVLKCIGAWNKYVSKGIITDINGKVIDKPVNKTIVSRSNRFVHRPVMPLRSSDNVRIGRPNAPTRTAKGDVRGSRAKAVDDAKEKLAIEALKVSIDEAKKRFDKLSYQLLKCEEVIKTEKPDVDTSLLFGVDVSDVTVPLTFGGSWDSLNDLKLYHDMVNRHIKDNREIRNTAIRNGVAMGIPKDAFPIDITEEQIKVRNTGHDLIKAVATSNILRNATLIDDNGKYATRTFKGSTYETNINGRYAFSAHEIERLESGKHIIAANVPSKSGKATDHYVCKLVKLSGEYKVVATKTDLLNPDFMDGEINESVRFSEEEFRRALGAANTRTYERMFRKQQQQTDAETKRTYNTHKQTRATHRAYSKTLSLGSAQSQNSYDRIQATYTSERIKPASAAAKKLGFETAFDENRFESNCQKVHKRIEFIDDVLAKMESSSGDYDASQEKANFLAEKESLLLVIDEYKREREMRQTPPSDEGTKKGYVSFWEETVVTDFEQLINKAASGKVVLDDHTKAILWRKQRLDEALDIREHGFEAHVQKAYTNKDTRVQYGVTIPAPILDNSDKDVFIEDVPDFC